VFLFCVAGEKNNKITKNNIKSPNKNENKIATVKEKEKLKMQSAFNAEKIDICVSTRVQNASLYTCAR